MSYRIVTDGSCDLPPALCAELGITVVPFYVSFDDKTYQRENADIGVRAFYDQMVASPGVFPKSSMPTAPDFAAAFEPAAAAGEDILCICITTKFSGSMQSALLAKHLTAEHYPNVNITVMDATVNTVLQGLFVLEAARLRAEGVPYAEAIARLEAIRPSGRIFFTIGSMDYLLHGGRVGKLAGKVTTLFKVRPMITLKEGEIFPSGIARSRQGSLDKVTEMLRAYLKQTGKPLESYSACIGYGYDKQEAEAFRVTLMAELGFSGRELFPLYQIGATIAVHTGPYPLGVGIIEKA